MIFQCESPNIVESKSLKLYFNSFNQTKVESIEAFQAILEKDLSAASGLPVSVELITMASTSSATLNEDKVPEPVEGPGGRSSIPKCIDHHDIEPTEYHVTPSLLTTIDQAGRFHVCSHLLRSNCPVTNQPDWATVEIIYEGKQIDETSLLAYIVSYRLHNGFHEECVERMFFDIQQQCQPKKLAIIGRFTRRGGLDINPVRANFDVEFDQSRTARQ